MASTAATMVAFWAAVTQVSPQAATVAGNPDVGPVLKLHDEMTRATSGMALA